MKVGEVVQLNSGSPAMTIAGIDEKTQALHCLWFAGTEVRRIAVDPAMIRVVQPVGHSDPA